MRLTSNYNAACFCNYGMIMPIVSFCDRKSAREMDRLIAEGPRNVHGWHTTIHLQRRDTTTALISYSADKKPKSWQKGHNDLGFSPLAPLATRRQ